MASPWQIAADTGGTFTDCLAIGPDGSERVLKVLSSGSIRGRVVASDGDSVEVDQPYPVPDGFFVGYRFRSLDGQHDLEVSASRSNRLQFENPVWPALEPGQSIELSSGEQAPIVAARLLTGTRLGARMPDVRLRLATTRGTNALLEHKGAPTVLFVTRGHGDLLRIGDQTRPDLFALEVRKPSLLYDVAIEVDERLSSSGEVLRALDLEQLDPQLSELRDRGFRCAAIALLHSYRNPEHEQLLKQALLERGFDHVAASAEVAPLIKILPRAQTAVVDAYLGPVIGDYVDSVGRLLEPNALHLMTSAGGLVRARDFSPRDSLLSGPAGGVVGAADAGRRAGHERLLTFDMGGTSTDVCRFDRDLEYDFEHRVGVASILAPAVAVTTVAAGGGSICSYRHGALKVGPESGGAEPGPACYGRGGPLTITDVNLLLGRLDESRFQIPIDRSAAEVGFHRLVEETGARNEENLLEGLLEIANETMAGAIRRISIQRGYDPREYALVSFGGAGGQHACRVADALEIERIVVPENAGLLSALGLRVARVERFAHRQLLRVLRNTRQDGVAKELSSELHKQVDELAAEAVARVCDEGIERDQVSLQRIIVRLRLLGQESTLEVDWDKGESLALAFDDSYLRTYGYEAPDRAVEIESIRAIAASDRSQSIDSGRGSSGRIPARARKLRTQRCWIDGRWQGIDVLERESLGIGEPLQGPLLVSEDHSLVVVEPGWSVSCHDSGALLLDRHRG